MTTMFTTKCRCAVCGTESEFMEIGSTNSFGGAPDLDLRPPQMMRSTMDLWVKECPECGYVAADLEKKTSVDEAWLQSEMYTTCRGMNFTSPLAAAFYRAGLITRKGRKTEDTFYHLLHAAWVCDDEGDPENAIRCRVEALPQLRKMMEKHPEDEELILLKIDIMRRAQLFDEVLAEFKGMELSSELLNSILTFQLARAEEKDAACYRVSDAGKQEK